MIETILRSNGYIPSTITRPNYRGCSMPARPITQVVKADFQGFAKEVADPSELHHTQKIQAVQASLPHVAKITEIITTVVITEKAPGTLLWELDSAPSHLSVIREGLEEIRQGLASVNLVHADIRPWNIMFDTSSGRITLFDWGFSFFVGDNPIGNIDGHLMARGFNRAMGHEITRRDIDNCLAILRSQKSPEEIWNHNVGEFTWRPPWCKPFTPQSNT